MINETERAELVNALALKEHFEDRISLARQYEEKVKAAATQVKSIYDKYQSGKALVEKACDLFELLK